MNDSIRKSDDALPTRATGARVAPSASGTAPVEAADEGRLAPWRRGLRVHAAGHRLEDRIMLDAAGAVAFDAALDAGSAPANLPADDGGREIAREGAGIAAPGDLDMNAADDDGSPTRREIVVVDTAVGDHESLLADIDGADDPDAWYTDPASGAERLDVVQDGRALTVYRVDGANDGIDGVTAVLRHESGADALHVLSHGSTAAITIGGERVDAGTLGEHADALAVWGDALAANGDILLYGCDTGGTEAGRAFVEAFALATRGDIAASDDPSGHERHGGDWELEVHEGTVESTLVVEDDAAAAFDALLASTPTATLAVPAESFINESFSFTVTVDNTGTDPGYEPYVDLFAEPGVALDGASFLGATVDLGTAYVWDAGAGAWMEGTTELAEHPLNAAIPLPADPGIDGMVWHVIEFPFGSFVPDQPAAVLAIDATLDKVAGAVAGTPLAIHAQAGFEYGENAFDDAAAGDPPVVGALATGTITPTVLEIIKEARSEQWNAVGDEDEHATGPNNPITWTITVDIANGETVDDVVIADLLGGDIHYTGGLSVTGDGTLAPSTAPGAPAQSPATVGVDANNALAVRFDSATGSASAEDIVIEYEGYIPETDAAGNPILTPGGGAADTTVRNVVTIDADYQAAPTAPVGTLTDTADHEIRPLSLATQKSVVILDSSGNASGRGTTVPGDILEWRLEVQVSDYFSLEGFSLTDRFGDGQLYIDGSSTLEVFENGESDSIAIDEATFLNKGAIDSNSASADYGLTTLVYDISGQLDAPGADPAIGGRLDGDLAGADTTVTDKTTFVVTFRTQVQENFAHPDAFGASENSSVDIGDRLTNTETVNATIVSGSAVSDGSGAAVLVTSPEASKTIYAIDGDTDGFDASDPELAPGQSVTYRITVDLPTNDIEGLVITDYLPLPVFDVTDTDGSGSADYAYAGSIGDPDAGFFSGVDDVPAAGFYGFGPGTDKNDFPNDGTNDFPGNFFALDASGELKVVDPGTDGAANSVRWAFQPFNQDGSSGGTIDLLFTTVTQDVRFTDGLNLTNQALIDYDNTNNPQEAVTEIVQIETLAPELALTQGVVSLSATSNGVLEHPDGTASAGPVAFNDPGTGGAPFTSGFDSAALAATPIDADATGLDAGDVVRFAIVVENSGGFAATDIALADKVPEGFVVPAAGAENFRAYLADGTTEVFTSGVLFDTNGDPDATGLALKSGSPTGPDLELGRGHVDDVPVTDSSNIVVLTYDLVVADTADADDVLAVDAEILAFAAFDGGTDYTAGNSSSDWQDDATVTLETAGLVKTLEGTSVAGNDLAPGDPFEHRAVAGEYVDYRLVITVPEGGLDGANVVDSLDRRLVFDGITSITASAGLSTDADDGDAGTSGFDNVTTSVATSGGQETVTFDLGNVVNANRDDSVTETLTIDYRVFVATSMVPNRSLGNDATLNWNRANANTGGTATPATEAGTVRTIAPLLDVTKALEGTAPSDVGDPVSYRITIEHATGSRATAFDVSLEDILPSQITLDPTTPLTVVTDESTDSAGFTISGNTLSNPSFDLAEGDRVVLLVNGTVSSATSGAPIDNTASIDWSTLDGEDADGDRLDDIDGLPGDGNLDAERKDYAESDTASFTVAPPAVVKSIESTGIDENGNDDTVVVQGEYIEYRVQIGVPEGVTPNAKLVDTLPANLTFDTSFTPTLTMSTGVEFANDPTPSANNAPPARNDSPPYTVSTDGREVTFDFGTITNSDRSNIDAEEIVLFYRVWVTGGSTSTPIENTATLRWDLNGDGDADDSIAGGDATDDGASEGSVSIDYREAVLEIDNTLLTGPAPVSAPSDGGDVARYEIVVSHAAGSTVGAFDVGITDALPPEFASATLVSAVHSTDGDISGDFDLTGTTLTSSDTFDLAPTETVTLILEGTLRADAPAGTSIDNEATVSWQSLGDPTHGVDGPNGGTPVESTDSASDANGTAFTLTDPTFEHVIVETGITNGVNAAGEVVAGERVVHELRVTVPEGTTRDASVTHTLPAGLVFLPGSVAVTQPGDVAFGSGVTPTTLGTPTVASGTGGTTLLTFDLGDVVNTDGDPAARDESNPETILIRFTSHARDSVATGTLTDAATLGWTEDANGDGTDESATLTDSDTLDVIEPQLRVENVVTDAPTQTGDDIEYTVTIRHTGAGDSADGYAVSVTDAFDVAFTDALPPGVTDAAIVSTELAGSGVAVGSGSPLAGFTLTGDDTNGYTVAHTGGFDLALGETVTLVISGKAGPASPGDPELVSGQTYDADATVTWTTLDGGSATDSADGDANEADGANGLTDTDSAGISLGNITKTILSTGIDESADADADRNDDTTVVAGEFVTYRVVVDVPQGSSPDAAIIDVLDAGLEFDPSGPFSVSVTDTSLVTTSLSGGFAGIDATDVSWTPGTAGTPAVSGTPGTLTLDLGRLENTAPDGVVQQLTLEYRVHVTDNAVDAAEGATLDTDVRFEWDTTDDADTVRGSASDGNVATTVPAVTVIAPHLRVDSAVTDAPGGAGETVEYTVTIRHGDGVDGHPLSATDAFDVTFANDIPQGVTGLQILGVTNPDGTTTAGNGTVGAGSTASGFVVTGSDAAGYDVSHAGFDLALGESVTLVLTGTAGEALAGGDLHADDARITWTTLDDDNDDGDDADADPHEGTGSDADASTFTLAGIEKTILSTGIDDATNDDTEVVPGEFVTYRVVVDVPLGTSPDAALIDTLDPGLVFDATGPFSVSVRDAGTGASSTLVTTDLVGGFAGIDAADASWVPGAAGAPGVLTVELGELGNTATAGDVQQLVFQFRVHADNSVDALPGTALDSTVRFVRDSVDDADTVRGGAKDDTATATVDAVTVREARLVITDTLVDEPAPASPARPLPVDAGDTATHRLVITHAPGSEVAAFDAALSHPLPVQYEGITNIGATLTATDGTTAPLAPAVLAGFVVTTDPGTGAQTLSHPDLDLALGETLTIEFDATVTVEAQASTTVSDTVSLTWESLGENAQGNQARQADTVSQAALVAAGATAVNPFATTDSTSFVVGDPALVRSILSSGIDSPANAGANDPVDGTEVVPGERVVHEVVVTVPEGTTRLAAVTETLADGLVFDPSFPVEVLTSAGVSFANDSGNAVRITPTVVTNVGADDTVTFDLGDVVNLDTVDADPDTITIRYATFADGNVVDRTTAGAPGPVLDIDSALRWDVDADGDNDAAADRAKIAASTATVTDDDSVTVIEPRLTITSEVVAVPSDTGDTVAYEIVVAHATGATPSTADAYDVAFTNVLPEGVESVTATAELFPSGGGPSSTVGGFVVTVDPATGVSTVSHPSVDLAFGDRIVLLVEGTVGAAIVEGDTIESTTSITWSSLDRDDDALPDSDPADSDSDPTDDGVDAVERVANANATATFSTADIAKVIVSTGIDDSAGADTNDDAQVVPGEFITYRVTVDLPQGTSPDAAIIDLLDAGLAFDPSEPISVSVSDPALVTTDLAGGFAGITTATWAPGTPGASGTPDVPGTPGRLTVELGRIENTAPAGSVQRLTLEYRAHATDNAVDVAEGNTLDSTVRFAWDTTDDADATRGGASDGTTATTVTPVTVIAPHLRVDNVVSDVPTQTGDSVGYTVTIRHTGAADAADGHAASATDAFDVTFTDAIPQGVTGLSIVSAENGAGTAFVGDGSTFGGFTVTGDDTTGYGVSHAGFDLALGESVTLVLAGTADAALLEGDAYDSDASIVWTSLDDDAPLDGNDASERSATDADAARFSLADIEKTILSTGIDDATNDDTEVVPGEFVTYQVVVDVPLGTSPDAAVIDTLDPGLVFDATGPFSVSVRDAGTGASSTLVTTDLVGGFAGIDATSATWAPGTVGTPGTPGTPGTLTLELGELVNGATAGDVQQLVIEYRAHADNTLDAAPGTTLDTNVRFEWDTTDDADAVRGGTSDGATATGVDAVTVREARLVITDTLVDEPAPASPARPVPVDAGDTATHRLVIAHAPGSEVAAFDAVLSHPLPIQYGNITNIGATLTATDGTTAPVTPAVLAGFVVTTDPVTGAQTLSHPDLDLALGETLTIEFDATVTAEAQASTTVSDTVSLTWQSLGEDTQGIQASQADAASQAALAAAYTTAGVTPATPVNPFATSDSTSFVVGDPALVRSIVSSGIDSPANTGANDPVDGTEIVPGERVVHEVVVTVPEGTTRLAAVTETLADGLAFDPSFPVEVLTSAGVSLAVDPGNTTPDVVSPASTDPGVVLTVAADVDAAGRDTVTFDLGDIVNLDTVDADPDTITIRYATFAEGDVVDRTTAGAPGPVLDIDSALRWDVDADGDNDAAADRAKIAASAATVTDDDSVTVIEPRLTIESAVVGVPSDTGDTVRYEIVVEHDGGTTPSTADAYDIAFTNVLPEGVESVSASAELFPSGGGASSTVGGFVVTVDPATGVSTVSHPSVDLAFGERIVLLVEGTVGTAIVEGDTIESTTSITWSSLDADDDALPDSDPADPDSDPTDDGVDAVERTGTVAATSDFSLGDIAKVIVSTGVDESGDADGDRNDDTTVVAGEFVTYRVTVDVPQGTSPDAALTDVLDAGLEFDPSGPFSVSVVDVASGADAGLVTTTLAGGFSGITPTWVPADPANGVPDGTLTVELGELGNTAASGAVQQLVLEYRAYATDDAVHAAEGAALDSTVRFEWDTTDDADSTRGSVTDGFTAVTVAPVTVIAPHLRVDNVVSDVPTQTGDSVGYTVTIRHTGAADVADGHAVSATDAFDVTFTGTVPQGVTGLSIVSAEDGAGAAFIGDGSAFGGFTITGDDATGYGVSHADFDLAFGESVTLVLAGTADAALIEGDAYDSDVAITWTTLDDANDVGSEGVDGDDADADPHEGSSADADSVRFSLADIAKTIVSTGIDDAVIGDPLDDRDVVAGEFVTYRVVVDVPLGTSPDAALIDVLDPGLVFDPTGTLSVAVRDAGSGAPSTLVATDLAGGFAGVDATGASWTPGTPGTATVPGTPGTLTLELGRLENTAAAGDVQQLVIEYRVHASNTIDAVPGNVLDTNVRFEWDTTDDADTVRGGTSDGATATGVDAVTVRETRLVISDDIIGTLPLDAGDDVRHRLVIAHDPLSNAHAFDAVLTHPLPIQYEGITNVSAVRTAADGVTTSPVTGFVVTVDPVTGAQTLSHPDLDLALGETLAIEFDAVTTVEVQSSTTVTDTVSLTWQSLGEDAQGIQASQADTASQAALAAAYTTAGVTPATPVNPFTTSDSTSFVVGDPTLARSIVSSGINSSANTGANDPVDGTEVVPGERVVHEVVVTVPEGTTRLAAVTETLADGLAFDASFPVTVVASAGVSLASDPGNATPDVVSPASADPGVVLTVAADVDAAGRDTVTFDLGDVVNLDTVDGDPDTITIRYATFADGDVVDRATAGAPGPVLDVDSALRWDTDADGDNDTAADRARLAAIVAGATPATAITGSDSATVIEPRLTIESAVVAVPSDTGDTVRYEIVVEHDDGSGTTPASTADAHDLTFTNALPNGIESVSATAELVSGVDGSRTSVTGFVVTVDPATGVSTVSHPSVDLAFGDRIVLLVEGTVGATVIEGDTIESATSITWSSLDADDDALPDSDPADPDSDPTDDGIDAVERVGTASATATFSAGDVFKRIVATGIDDAEASATLLAGSGAGAVAVTGEWIDYEIVFVVPQGTTSVAEIVDVLDPGVVFDATSGIRVVASSADVTTSSGNGDFADATAVPGAGNTLSIALGDITNAASPGTVETLTVTYRVHVGGGANAAPGSVLDANATNVRWDIDGDGTNTGTVDGSSDAAAAPIVVAAPVLDVTSTVSDIPSDEGDRIEYTFVIAHTDASTAGAKDVRFTDVLPASLSGLAIDSATRTDGTTVDGFLLSGNTLVQEDATLDLGDTITVVVSGTVTGASPGDTAPSTAMIWWSSLDDDVATDGADGRNPANERTAFASDDESFSIADVTKTLVSTGIDRAMDANGQPLATPAGPNTLAEVVPGEYVVYEIVVTVPESGAPSATLVDTLGHGLVFDALLDVRTSSDALTTSLDGGLGNVAVPSSGTGGTLLFALGDLANTDRADGRAETVTLTYRAMVTNTADVAAGDTLSSDVDFRWDIDADGATGGTADGTTVDAPRDLAVLEPVLTLAGAVDDTDPHLGQRVTFTLTLDNPGAAGGTDAHDLVLLETLPPELALDPASIRVNGEPLANVAGITDRTADNRLALDIASLDHGGTLVVTYEAVVTTDPADANLPVASAASLTWSTLSAGDAADGLDANERGPDDGYTLATSTPLTPVAPDYAVGITSDADAPLATGDPIRHTVTLDNVGTHLGTGLVVRIPWPVDTLDPPVAISDGGVFDPDTNEVVWRLDTLAAGDGTTFTVDTTVRATQGADLDTDPASENDAFTLVASVGDDGRNGADPDPSNDTAASTARVEAEPDYTASIVNDIDRASPTGKVPYRIDVANVGDQGGTGIVVVHRFDPAIVRIIDPAGGVVDAGAGTLTWRVDALGANESLVFEPVAEVLTTAFLTTPDQLFTGSVEVSDDLANGADPTPDDARAEHADMLLGGPGDPQALIGPATSLALAPGPETTFESIRQGVGTGRLFNNGMDPDGDDGQLRLDSFLPIPDGRYGPRVLTSDDLFGELDEDGLALSIPWLRGDLPQQDGGPRAGEDDPIRGGDLVDVFRNDVRTCEVVGVDWTRYEPSREDLGLPSLEAATPADGSDGSGTTAAPTADDAANVPAQDLSSSIAREYLRLHGAGESALVEAFRSLDAVPTADAPAGEDAANDGAGTVGVTDAIDGDGKGARDAA